MKNYYWIIRNKETNKINQFDSLREITAIYPELPRYRVSYYVNNSQHKRYNDKLRKFEIYKVDRRVV